MELREEFESRVDLNKRKFFIHLSFPSMSGYLHAGHMRGYAYADIIARYKRMTGFNVLFGAGFDPLGIPTVSFARKVRCNDKEAIDYLKRNDCPEKTIPRLGEPEEVIRYFSNVYTKEWKTFAFSIDYSRLFSTSSLGFKKFIRWQFRKLAELRLLVQKSRYTPLCPRCGPVAKDVAEADISRGGKARIIDFALVKFPISDGTILPAATLRPETVFGITNIWVNPEAMYAKTLVNNEVWIVSLECAKKLCHSKEKIEVLTSIKGIELTCKTCKNPLTRKEIPILPASFVKSNVATGVVMSVPAHAPFDWMALVDLNSSITPIQVIDFQDFKDHSPRLVCEKLNITCQDDVKKLERATKLLYKKEFHSGILNERCGKYAGFRVCEAKQLVENDLIKIGIAENMKDFSDDVICRCGHKVVIKNIPNQWFIRYGDVELREQAKKYTREINIYPKEDKEKLLRIIDHFEDRACVRRGNWIGASFPIGSTKWIIEPLSQVTLYLLYCFIAKYINSNEIKEEDLTDKFFDYVFLGKGKPQATVWEEIRKEVDYWYPVDINVTGKEHRNMHVPTYIMTHIAVLPREKWPKGFLICGWVTQRTGGKISKSKGGAEPLRGIIEKFTIDAIRLYYAHSRSTHNDIEWNLKLLWRYEKRIKKIRKMLDYLITIEDSSDETSQDSIDGWLLSNINRRIWVVISAMKNMDLREATSKIFFEIYNDIKWYLRREGRNKCTIAALVNTWIKLMAPFTPYLSQEYWQRLGNDGCISSALYPRYTRGLTNDSARMEEEYLMLLMKDTHNIAKARKEYPKKIMIITAPPWKQHNPALRDMNEPKPSAKASLGRTIARKSQLNNGNGVIDENRLLNDNLSFLSRELNVTIRVKPYEQCTSEELQVFLSKAKLPIPSKPAIYVME